jgi:hypothetical protein
MKKDPRKERRLYPRIDRRMPVKIIANGYDFATSTLNISCVGAYCRINKYVPPFTRVMIKLSFPPASNNDSSVECKGVIVRTEDAPDGGFNIAVFFNQINEPQRQKISRYLDQFFPQTSPA